MPTRILITGGAGFVGSHLTEALLARGHEAHLIVRPGSDDERIRRFEGRIHRHTLELESEVGLKKIFANVRPDLVFHLATTPRRSELSSLRDSWRGPCENVDVLVNLLNAANCHPPKMFVRAGTLAEYGAAPTPYGEWSREAPKTMYGAEMIAATRIAEGLQQMLPFPVITARLALVYGGWQSTDYLVPRLIQQCLAGRRFVINHPNDRRDLIYVDDAVTGLIKIASTPRLRENIINVATGIAPSMRDVAHLIVEKTGAEHHHVEYGREGDSSGISELRGDTRRALQLVGWKSRTSLEDGLTKTIAWYADRRSPPQDSCVLQQ